MSRLLAIDPGVRAFGLAVFDGALIRAALIDVPVWTTDLPEAARVVIEFPRIYPGPRQKGDQNDLMQLARVCGRLQEAALRACSTVEFVEPRTWKGTLDGDEMVERIKERLSGDEHARVALPSAKSLHHNVFDAVGVGLWKLGRLAPRKVFPR